MPAEGFTNAAEQDVLDAIFAGAAIPTMSHIGLFTTAPNEDGTGGVEVTGGSYARVAYAQNATNWPAASGTAPAQISNGVEVTFTQATVNWGTVVAWGYFSAITGGVLNFAAALTANKAVDDGDTAKFAVGALIAKLGDPGDTY